MPETFRREIAWQPEFRGAILRATAMAPTAEEAERAATPPKNLRNRAKSGA